MIAGHWGCTKQCKIARLPAVWGVYRGRQGSCQVIIWTKRAQGSGDEAGGKVRWPRSQRQDPWDCCQWVKRMAASAPAKTCVEPVNSLQYHVRKKVVFSFVRKLYCTCWCVGVYRMLFGFLRTAAQKSEVYCTPCVQPFTAHLFSEHVSSQMKYVMVYWYACLLL